MQRTRGREAAADTAAWRNFWGIAVGRKVKAKMHTMSDNETNIVKERNRGGSHE